MTSNILNSPISRGELEEWVESWTDLVERVGPEAAANILSEISSRTGEAKSRLAQLKGSDLVTPYCNTIPPEDEPDYPGNRDLETQLGNWIRWNAWAMVVRANQKWSGLGGHLSTYASVSDLFEVGMNHFFHGASADDPGDLIYFQGHASPGVYSRAFLEGRLSASQLDLFRQEALGKHGLSSYPHPWLMPDFWQFPTVSMGLSPIMAVYQARFLRYLHQRGKLEKVPRVWCFLGDGEMDEPESLGALPVAAREDLSNLIFVVNANLQRLDGPVRGSGKLIQELERIFCGCDWNVIKVIWSGDWDPLFEQDQSGDLLRRMNEAVDGDYQKYCVESGGYMREHFFGTSPALSRLVADWSDDQLHHLRRGGHDPRKIYAAYQRATELSGPTVILAKTIKGYGLGSAAEGLNVTHQQKKLNLDQLKQIRDDLGIELDDHQLETFPYIEPDEASPAIRYLRECRQRLGGYVPWRRRHSKKLDIPDLSLFKDVLRGHEKRDQSTTKEFGRILGELLDHESIGWRIVPIIPDEARTFGLEPLFSRYGIYAAQPQKYEPVDANSLLRYRESTDGQILEEGITEAGAMSSFIAAGTAYSSLNEPMIPFYTFYSMFGFQRVGDLIWAAADARSRGILCGGTAGRSTLSGEGLQHQDGHSQLVATTIPNMKAYDPAFGYEIAVIIQDGLRRMYQDDESIFYYLTLYNRNYPMPALPEGHEDEILRGMHPVASSEAASDQKQAIDVEVQILASGPLVAEAMRAQQLLADEAGVSSQVWSVTSWSELARDAEAVHRRNRLYHSQELSFLETRLQDASGPFLGVSDYIRLVAQQIAPWVPGSYIALGTDGFGRSDHVEALRSHFEISAEHIAYNLCWQIYEQGDMNAQTLGSLQHKWSIQAEKRHPRES